MHDPKKLFPTLSQKVGMNTLKWSRIKHIILVTIDMSAALVEINPTTVQLLPLKCLIKLVNFDLKNLQIQ